MHETGGPVKAGPPVLWKNSTNRYAFVTISVDNTTFNQMQDKIIIGELNYEIQFIEIKFQFLVELIDTESHYSS